MSRTHSLVNVVRNFPANLDPSIVSPETGLGAVPRCHSGRLFRDEIGPLNQQLAAVCDRVILVVAGYPMGAKVAG